MPNRIRKETADVIILYTDKFNLILDIIILIFCSLFIYSTYSNESNEMFDLILIIAVIGMIIILKFLYDLEDVLKDINLSGFVGGNIRSFKYNSSYVTTDYLNVPGVFSFANSRNPLKAYSFNSNMIVLSGYYSLDLSLKKFFTLSTKKKL